MKTIDFNIFQIRCLSESFHNLTATTFSATDIGEKKL